MYAYMLGRQSELGLEELKSLSESSVELVRSGKTSFAVTDTKIPIAKLGGSVKRYRIIAQDNLAKTLIVDLIYDHAKVVESGRISIGFESQAAKFGLKSLIHITKDLETRLNKKVRLINSGSVHLNSASSVHNKTYKQHKAFEYLLLDGSRSVVGILDDVQNLRLYTLRDRGRPARDAAIGMLPPKLAQIMINLACGPNSQTVLDPFCGTGVVLQEAALIGHNCFGTDINPDMVQATNENLAWLHNKLNPPGRVTRPAEKADAQYHDWQQPFGCVVSETYLGKALSRRASVDEARGLSKSVSQLQSQFMSNVSRQMGSGQKICISLPAWLTSSDSIVFSEMIDKQGFKDYNLSQIAIGKQGYIVYSRPEQSVARCIILLNKD